MKKWMLGLSVSGGTILSIGAGAGIVAGIVVPKALKARDAAATAYSTGGPRQDLKARLKKKGHLKVVGLGDSVTAGYNGILGADSYSYIDFLVKGLRDALGGKDKIIYKNYAQSGLRLSDYYKIVESPEAVRELHEADLITVTLGANDILSVVKLLEIPFNMGPEFLTQTADILETFNPETLKLDKNETLWNKLLANLQPHKTVNQINQYRKQERETELMLDKKSADIMWNSIYDLIAISDGKAGNLINLDVSLKVKIYDFIKQEIAFLVKKLHRIAPKANISILGAIFPFWQFPEQVLTSKNKSTWDKTDTSNETLIEKFYHFLGSVKEGAEVTVDKPNDFVDFIKLDDLEGIHGTGYVKNAQGIYEKGKDFKEIDYADEDTYFASTEDMIVPNIKDIHPSIYGHSLIGQALFKKYGKEIGLTDQAIADHLPKSIDYQGGENGQAFEELDRNEAQVKATYESNKIFNKFLSSWSLLPDDMLNGLYFLINDKVNPLTKKKIFEYDKQYDPTNKDEFKAYYKAGVKFILKTYFAKTNNVTDLSQTLVKQFLSIASDFVKTKFKGIQPIFEKANSYILDLIEKQFDGVYEKITNNLKDNDSFYEKLSNAIVEQTTDSAFALRQAYDITVKNEIGDLEYTKYSLFGVAAFFELAKTIPTILEAQVLDKNAPLFTELILKLKTDENNNLGELLGLLVDVKKDPNGAALAKLINNKIIKKSI